MYKKDEFKSVFKEFEHKIYQLSKIEKVYLIVSNSEKTLAVFVDKKEAEVFCDRLNKKDTSKNKVKEFDVCYTQPFIFKDIK